MNEVRAIIFMSWSEGPSFLPTLYRFGGFQSQTGTIGDEASCPSLLRHKLPVVGRREQLAALTHPFGHKIPWGVFAKACTLCAFQMHPVMHVIHWGNVYTGRGCCFHFFAVTISKRSWEIKSPGRIHHCIQ
jgi:hypothetical protein